MMVQLSSRISKTASQQQTEKKKQTNQTKTQQNKSLIRQLSTVLNYTINVYICRVQSIWVCV